MAFEFSCHPGWPLPVGPLRVPAGVVGCGRCGCATPRQWSRIRLADRAHLEPWEPSADVDWEARHAVSQWPSVCSGLRSEARKGRMLPYVIEVDGEFSGQLTIGNVTHGALRSAWIGYWVASSATGGGVATAALALGLDHCFGPVQAASAWRRRCGRRTRRAARCWPRSGSARRACCGAISTSTAAWRDHLLVAITVEEINGSVDVVAGARGPRQLGLTPPLSPHGRRPCDFVRNTPLRRPDPHSHHVFGHPRAMSAAPTRLRMTRGVLCTMPLVTLKSVQPSSGSRV